MFDGRDVLQHRCATWEFLAGRNCARCYVFPQFCGLEGSQSQLRKARWCGKPAARESDLEVKIVKNRRSRNVFGSSKCFSRGKRTYFDTLQITGQAQEFVRVAKTLALNEDIKFLNGTFGHQVLMARTQAQYKPVGYIGFARANLYDRKQAQESVTAHKTHDYLQLEGINWEAAVKTHWRKMRNNLLNKAAVIFPKQERKQRQAYINESTWENICDSQRRRKHWTIRRHVLKQCFQSCKSGNADEADWTNLCIHTLQLLRCDAHGTHDQTSSRFQAEENRLESLGPAELGWTNSPVMQKCLWMRNLQNCSAQEDATEALW